MLKKYVLTLLGICSLLVSVKAQNFTAFEYFFTIDPGVGQATPITGVPSGNSINFTTNIIPPANIQPGFHTLCIRGKSSTGSTNFPALQNRWSVAYSLPVIIFPASTATANGTAINRMEYFFTNDPGFGNATGVAISPTNGNVTVPITISNAQAPGFYGLSYRVRTQAGQWSVTNTLPFIVWSNAVNPNNSPIVKLEYYIDFDPGNGFGTDIPFTPNPASSIQTALRLDLTGLTLGDHIIYVRALDSQDIWSSPKQALININCETGVTLYTAQTGNWHTMSTWACGRIPTITDKVYIKSPHNISLNANQTGNCLTIDTDKGAVLNIPQGAVFRVNPN